jgi:hypothetical protein
MSFLPSLAGVIAAFALAAAPAAAQSIPGPPLPASDRAGEFCPVRPTSAGNVASFAIGLAFVALAARRGGSRA